VKKTFFETLKTSRRDGIGTVSEPEKATGNWPFMADGQEQAVQQLINKEQGIHGNPEEESNKCQVRLR
jgi:hypothetical protein